MAEIASVAIKVAQVIYDIYKKYEALKEKMRDVGDTLDRLLKCLGDVMEANVKEDDPKYLIVKQMAAELDALRMQFEEFDTAKKGKFFGKAKTILSSQSKREQADYHLAKLRELVQDLTLAMTLQIDSKVDTTIELAHEQSQKLDAVLQAKEQETKLLEKQQELLAEFINQKQEIMAQAQKDDPFANLPDDAAHFWKKFNGADIRTVKWKNFLKRLNVYLSENKQPELAVASEQAIQVRKQLVDEGDEDEEVELASFEKFTCQFGGLIVAINTVVAELEERARQEMADAQAKVMQAQEDLLALEKETREFVYRSRIEIERLEELLRNETNSQRRAEIEKKLHTMRTECDEAEKKRMEQEEALKKTISELSGKSFWGWLFEPDEVIRMKFGLEPTEAILNKTTAVYNAKGRSSSFFGMFEIGHLILTENYVCFKYPLRPHFKILIHIADITVARVPKKGILQSGLGSILPVSWTSIELFVCATRGTIYPTTSFNFSRINAGENFQNKLELQRQLLSEKNKKGQEDTFMEGFLVLNDWQVQYFKLYHDRLIGFEDDKPNASVSIVVPIASILACSAMDEEEHAFCVVTQEAKYDFKAIASVMEELSQTKGSEDEFYHRREHLRNQWVTALQSSVPMPTLTFEYFSVMKHNERGRVQNRILSLDLYARALANVDLEKKTIRPGKYFPMDQISHVYIDPSDGSGEHVKVYFRNRPFPYDLIMSSRERSVCLKRTMDRLFDPSKQLEPSPIVNVYLVEESTLVGWRIRLLVLQRSQILLFEEPNLESFPELLLPLNETNFLTDKIDIGIPTVVKFISRKITREMEFKFFALEEKKQFMQQIRDLQNKVKGDNEESFTAILVEQQAKEREEQERQERERKQREEAEAAALAELEGLESQNQFGSNRTSVASFRSIKPLKGLSAIGSTLSFVASKLQAMAESPNPEEGEGSSKTEAPAATEENAVVPPPESESVAVSDVAGSEQLAVESAEIVPPPVQEEHKAQIQPESDTATPPPPLTTQQEPKQHGEQEVPSVVEHAVPLSAQVPEDTIPKNDEEKTVVEVEEVPIQQSEPSIPHVQPQQPKSDEQRAPSPQHQSVASEPPAVAHKHNNFLPEVRTVEEESDSGSLADTDTSTLNSAVLPLSPASGPVQESKLDWRAVAEDDYQQHLKALQTGIEIMKFSKKTPVLGRSKLILKPQMLKLSDDCTTISVASTNKSKSKTFSIHDIMTVSQGKASRIYIAQEAKKKPIAPEFVPLVFSFVTVSKKDAADFQAKTVEDVVLIVPTLKRLAREMS